MRSKANLALILNQNGEAKLEKLDKTAGELLSHCLAVCKATGLDVDQ